MELRELLQSSRLNQSPIRHDAESLEMRGPVLAEIDVLDVSAFRDGAIQCPVVESKILLLKLLSQIIRQCTNEYLCCSVLQRNRARPGHLFSFSKLHQVQDIRLLGNRTSLIDAAGKQTFRQYSTLLGIDVDASLAQQQSHGIERDTTALSQDLRMPSHIFLLRHRTSGHAPGLIALRIVFDDVIENRWLWLVGFLLYLKHEMLTHKLFI